jgi:hypothetical protein
LTLTVGDLATTVDGDQVRMARLPNIEQAILEARKIEDYCLNPDHPRGRHKARVFRDALGIVRNDAEWLRKTLLESLHDSEAIELASDAFGSRWRVDMRIRRHGITIMVRTVWIVQTGEQVPHFVTCWVL